MASEVRPPVVEDEHLRFLDKLRETGRVNMFGAVPYLVKEFNELTNADARTILRYWMESFDERNPE